jgi:hypothetical protein
MGDYKTACNNQVRLYNLLQTRPFQPLELCQDAMKHLKTNTSIKQNDEKNIPTFNFVLISFFGHAQSTRAAHRGDCKQPVYQWVVF